MNIKKNKRAQNKIIRLRYYFGIFGITFSPISPTQYRYFFTVTF